MKNIKVAWNVILGIALAIGVVIVLICLGAINVKAQQCSALTKSSNYTKQCSREVTPGTNFCFQHQNATKVVAGSAVGTPRSNQCVAITKKSNFTERCKKTAVKGSTMCEIHQRINHQHD